MSRDSAIQVEVVKVAMIQDKSGYIMRIALHPNDDIGPLISAPVGARFVAAFVEVDERQQPVVRKSTNTQVMQAGMLVQQPAFRDWMHSRGYASGTDEDSCLAGLYALLGINSRAQLADSEEASNKWDRIYREFVGSRGF